MTAPTAAVDGNGTPTGANLCTVCARRLTCRYVGRGRGRKAVCKTCQKAATQ